MQVSIAWSNEARDARRWSQIIARDLGVPTDVDGRLLLYGGRVTSELEADGYYERVGPESLAVVKQRAPNSNSELLQPGTWIRAHYGSTGNWYRAVVIARLASEEGDEEARYQIAWVDMDPRDTIKYERGMLART